MKLPLLILLFFLGSEIVFAQNEEKKPLVIGESITFHSSILKENREIHIFLPPGYNPSDSVRYPLIYILDGGIDEDFIHVMGVLHYNMLPWIEKVPASIIVGIGGNNRRSDFTFAVENLDFLKKEGFESSYFPEYGRSEHYMNFIEKELQNLIVSHYRISNHRTVIGESMAGLFLSEILLKRPYLFDKYIIISPSLWWGNRELITNASSLFQKNLKEKKDIYIGFPQREDDVRMYNDAETFYQIIKAQPLLNVYKDYLTEETHATILLPALMNACKQWKM